MKNKIHLYKQGYVQGEVRSSNYEKRIKQEKRLNEKLDLADTIQNLTPYQNMKTINSLTKELIHEFPNFKELHSKASNEEIILSFILYSRSILKQKNTDFTDPIIQETIQEIVPHDKQNTFPRTYEIIFWKIILHNLNKNPIRPTTPEHIDHNILYKG